MTVTTIRVSVETRNRLADLRNQAEGTSSIEDVLAKLLDEHAARALAERMRLDAEHARTNRDDRAEVEAVQAELDELGAW